MSANQPKTTDLGDDPDRLLSVPQFAAWAGVSESTARSWITEGTSPPVIRLGRQIRFRVGDIRAWIRGKASGTQATPNNAA